MKPSKKRLCKECGVSTLYISWSSLRSHMECKQKGMLQRGGFRAKQENQRVFFPGTVTDRVVRDWLLAEPEKNPNLMPQMVESIMQREADLIEEGNGKLIWRDKNDMATVLQDCIEAVTKIEPSLNTMVLPYDYDVDFRFKAPLMAPHPHGGSQKIILNGAMDIIVRDSEGRWAVWDVKHTRDNDYWKKTRGQLSFYDLATMIMFGQPTFAVGLLQPLCDKRVKPFQLDGQDRSSLMQSVLGMASSIWKEDFETTTDSEQCQFCNVKHACSKFKPVQTGTTRKFSLI